MLFFIPHASKRLQERNISITDCTYCLYSGHYYLQSNGRLRIADKKIVIIAEKNMAIFKIITAWRIVC